MTADGSRTLSRLERHAVSAAQILVRVAIALQVRKFQSASRGKQRLITATLAMLELGASALGLLLWAGERLQYVLAACKPRDRSLQAFDASVAAFANPGRAKGSSVIP